MPEKSQKRKLRSDPSSSLENVESTSQASDENTCLTEQDFSDISNKIENRLSKRLRDAEFGQREILKLIENLASKVDGLSNSATEPSGSVLRHDIEPESIGNSEPIGNSVNVSSNMVTGVSANHQENHQRSSSLPPPNQRYPDDIIDKLLQSLQTATTNNPGVPRLPKAMSTTMPTFDGKTDKFEHFEDLFQTSLKVYPNITEEEKIHYFHSLLRGEALQTFRNMTEATREHLNDILAGFRRRYVRQQSVATARCKWENLSFNPSQQTFPDFLEQYQKLAQEAYGEDAPPIHRNILLCKNATTPQEGPKPGKTRNRIVRDNGTALGTRNRTQWTRYQRQPFNHRSPQHRTQFTTTATKQSPQNNGTMLWVRQPRSPPTKLQENQSGQTIPKNKRSNSIHSLRDMWQNEPRNERLLLWSELGKPPLMVENT